MKSVSSISVPVAVLVVALVGCDATGTTDTAILNANSPIPPIAEYTFEYTPENLTESGRVEVVSQGTDDLGGILDDNGFRREDVVSARVDSVRLTRLSPPKTIPVRPKVFDYLTGATAFLGSDAIGTRIADDTFRTTAKSVSLEVASSDVTELVRSGPRAVFLRLSISSADEVPSRDRVRATVYLQIEVQGV